MVSVQGGEGSAVTGTEVGVGGSGGVRAGGPGHGVPPGGRVLSSAAVLTPRACTQAPLGPRGRGLRPARAEAARPGATLEGPGPKTGFYITRAPLAFVWFWN